MDNPACGIFKAMEQELKGYSRLVRMFCTPPAPPANERETAALKKAEKFTIGFPGWDLPGYAWGEGPTVLLCHGWGSRAGHLVKLAGTLAQSGFRAVAFDAPAHYSLPAERKKECSNMLEFGRAISLAAASQGGVHAVFGHSLGAIAALFALAEFPLFEKASFSCRKLVLASAPANVGRVIANFCRQNSLGEEDCRRLEKELETTFAMSLDDYDCVAALQAAPGEKMIVQDGEDQYFTFAETLAGPAADLGARVLVTRGLGHNLVLASRQVFREIIGFLKA
jgi:pimeloyl-ACP methyl ester carboxylesterase